MNSGCNELSRALERAKEEGGVGQREAYLTRRGKLRIYEEQSRLAADEAVLRHIAAAARADAYYLEHPQSSVRFADYHGEFWWEWNWSRRGGGELLALAESSAAPIRRGREEYDESSELQLLEGGGAIVDEEQRLAESLFVISAQKHNLSEPHFKWITNKFKVVKSWLSGTTPILANQAVMDAFDTVHTALHSAEETDDPIIEGMEGSKVHKILDSLEAHGIYEKDFINIPISELLV